MTALALPRLSRRSRRAPAVLPGRALTLGLTITWLSLVVLLPLSAVVLSAASPGWEALWHGISSPRVRASLLLSFGSAFVAALVNLLFGGLTAWVLVRYPFPARKLVDALVDLPFALPTAVAGIALATLHAPQGWIGRWLAPLGLQVAFAPAGIVVALIFIGLPFVVRTVQPVLEDLAPEYEEAARSLGASRAQVFVHVVLPAMLPALLTGFALAFARAAGEYGSVIFIAGNMPMVSEIAPLLIVTRLEQYDVAGATAIAVAMLALSFTLLLAINLLQGASRTHATGRRAA
ncbi:MAG: sulfate ABC transporter permease subunit CysT [Comamonas sp. SCN 65-56]|uniref:sulfate ABC transporter permease subunit CysT n=1 Tax=Comamonas sp. SCN 65-56 TaxID=1660095 RepID=UPI00086AF3B5|nr:sulfate ABC transporter permease subunit CysT [Comamonas sp. SCN 65-56]ODS92829.1 MAG: sulfate ABC transporter permease subunit CysT [Comamonas sp. SCN 65-56]